VVGETTIEETGVGVGVTSTLAVGVALFEILGVAFIEIKGKLFFKESLPVNIATLK
jgi:hypothetical protein